MVRRLAISVVLAILTALGTGIPLPGLTRLLGRSDAAGPSTGPTSIIAEMAVVLDEASHQILYARAPHQRVAPASLTKMVTALVALERGQLADRVSVDIDSARLAAETDSSVMGLMPGDELTIEQLLVGLLLSSGNDAAIAIAIARHIAGGEDAFVEMMNRIVREMGLRNTHFANPHGLDADGHYSTAYDLAIIARTAMQNPTIARIVRARRAMMRLSEGRTLEFDNGNPLIGKYRGADGVKTGYTDEAHLAIAATAQRDGRRLYVVLIRSADMEKDAASLIDYYFPLPVLFSLRTVALFPLDRRQVR